MTAFDDAELRHWLVDYVDTNIGCSPNDVDFDPAMFADKAAHPNVKCVSLKLSQGAKPGIGGVLPARR